MNKSLPRTPSVSPPPENESISIDVVEAVADAACVSPMDLEPLVSAIDPDALDALIGSMDYPASTGMGTVEFPYAGYDVVVGADESVRVRERHD